MATEAEIAWAAGLFEGEGCISFNGRGSYMPKMQITMSDRDVLERFLEIVACGSILEKPFQRAPHHKRQWSWRAHGTIAHGVFLALRPWLHQRRQARGDEVFTHLSGKGPGGHRPPIVAADGTAKECTGCRTVKPLDEFNRSAKAVLGREPRCRDCVHAAYRAYWLANTEKIRARNRDANRRRRAAA